MTTVSRGKRYELKSSGHGYVYVLTDHRDQRDVALIGEDAVMFERDMFTVELLLPTGDPDAILGYLWCQMDYELASRPIS